MILPVTSAPRKRENAILLPVDYDAYDLEPGIRRARPQMAQRCGMPTLKLDA